MPAEALFTPCTAMLVVSPALPPQARKAPCTHTTSADCSLLETLKGSLNCINDLLL